jgi:Putative Flp pilus-assembly TadE/G-like
MKRHRANAENEGALGQVLVLFALFLLVLLAVSALGIDYANWLLTDRRLQNVADHAALAGASQFDIRLNGSCGGAPAECVTARALAWKSLANDLNLRDAANAELADPAIQALAAGDSPSTGQASGTYGGQSITFTDKIWVATPPPNYAAYTAAGGRYTLNYGVTFVRVDRSTTAFLSGALGIKPSIRTGWATAGALPTDYALEVFCRNQIAPQGGVCDNSAGLTIDGQGGIRLVRGDIGSNESLTVTSNTGSGVIVEAGNMFLVNRTCASSTWTCPQIPATKGGISDADPVANPGTAHNKSAFYIAPIPVPKFASPLDNSGVGLTDTTTKDTNCSGADAAHLCVPYRPLGSSAPGDWTCQTSGIVNRCGIRDPLSPAGTVNCIGQGGGSAPVHYYPYSFAAGANAVQGDSGHPPLNTEWENINDDALTPAPDTATTPANPPNDWLYTGNLNITGSGTRTVTSTFTMNLQQSGPRLSGLSTVRYVVFKTDGENAMDTGYPVTVTVSLRGGVTAPVIDTTRTLTGTPTRYEFTVNPSQITDYNSLQLKFDFSETGIDNNTQERGGGVSWAEIEHPAAQPPTAPMIPPGYYRSITLPDNTCAILDPTAEYSSLLNYQMPGIYRFGGSGSSNSKTIDIGTGSYLIGDGVTLAFDSGWPDTGSGGINIDGDGALVLNTMRVVGTTPPCTPSEPESSSVNNSAPYLGTLPYSAVCAAWSIDHNSAVIQAGANAWHYCDTSLPDSGAHCVERSSYNPPATYRGITFYFTPDPNWSTAHASMNIRRRFYMGGSSGAQPGIAFRGVLYAPYDNVKITGGNGFNTVGQVLAWTAKFNGGSASIDLDYPYDYTPAAPYLLEPTVSH